MQPSPTRLPTQARQAEIVAAALRLAAQRSPAGITTTEIAGALGLSQGALFRHFETKEAVWLAVMEWVDDRLGAVLDAAEADHATPLAGLRAMFLAHIGFVAAHPGVPRILFHELQQCNDTPVKQRVRTILQSYRQRLMRRLAAAVAAGEAAPDLDQAAAATLFIGSVQGLVMQSMLADHPSAMLGQAEHVIEVYLRAIRETT